MRMIPDISMMYAFYQIHNKLLSTQPSPATMRNELTERKPHLLRDRMERENPIQLPEQVLEPQGERKEQITIDDRVYESLSEPLRFENICTLEASDCLNDRVTVTVTVETTEHSGRPPHRPDRPRHPEKPPHHGRDWFETGHRDRSETGHYDGVYDKCGKISCDKPHRPPHKEPDCGNPGTTVTLTFVKSLGLSSIYTSENTLTVNNEKILLNSEGGALLVMPDDTLRWGRLKPEILEQIRQQSKQDDFPGEGGEESGNKD